MLAHSIKRYESSWASWRDGSSFSCRGRVVADPVWLVLHIDRGRGEMSDLQFALGEYEGKSPGIREGLPPVLATGPRVADRPVMGSVFR